MSRKFGFETVDIERIKRNLKAKSQKGRKDRAAHLEPLDLEKAKHLQVEPGERPLPSSNKSSPTFNPQNLLPLPNEQPPPKPSPSPSTSHFDRDAPLPPLPTGDAPKPQSGPKSPSLHKKRSNLRPLESHPYKAKSAEHLRSAETLRSYPQDVSRNRVYEDMPKTPASIGESPFDLRPPPPNRPQNTLAGLSEQLFSPGHLRTILHDPALFFRFTSFLNAYRPNIAPVLVRYLETQKAIKAVEYANAIAESVASLPGDSTSNIPCAAALLDARFEQRCKRAFDVLLVEALPSYTTYCLTKSVTECLVKEVTGISMPFMRDMVSGLTEVFCISDPSIKDCPIIYASDEFHRMTQYGRDYAIGRNCRFLQGPKTNTHSTNRLRQAIKDGQELCETILNYRRDGSAFFNLLMMAPLLDNRGRVKYYIGAQVDVSGLVKDGLGLESFERHLADERKTQQESEKKTNSYEAHTRESRVLGAERALKTLKELSEMFSLEESNTVQSHSRSNSFTRESREQQTVSSPRDRPRHRIGAGGRRVLLDGERSDSDEAEEPSRRQTTNQWANLSSVGPSGKLPGVYQNYLLIRPGSSMRIIFTSSSLQGVGNLTQTPFLSHVSAPTSTIRGLEEAFAAGIPVTAKISWYPNGKPDNLRSDSRLGNGTLSPEPGDDSSSQHPTRGLTRWMSATPLLGSDDRVGVWIVLMVEKGHYGTIKQRVQSPTPTQNLPLTPKIFTPDHPSKERRVLDESTTTNSIKARRVLDLVSHTPKPPITTHTSATATVLNSDTDTGFDDFASVTSAAINGVVSSRALTSADSGIGHADEYAKGDGMVRIPITNGLVINKPLADGDAGGGGGGMVNGHRTLPSENSDLAESLMRVPALAPRRSVTPNEERTFSL